MVLIVFFTIYTPFYHHHHYMVGTFRIRKLLDISLNGPTQFFQRFNAGRELMFYKDGPICSVAVIEFPKLPSFTQKPLAIFVNGKSDSDTIRDIYTLRLSAHISALLAESRKDVMVIGLGTGVTAGELTLYPEVEHIDIAEISPAVVEAFPLFQAFTYNAHKDPRVRMHIGDAFRILGRSPQKWDIIISEPSNPWTTGVDLLFTQEYYKLVKEHLTENGILVQWTQLYATNPQILSMILNTVQQEFSQCRVFRANPGDLLIVASDKRFSDKDVTRAEEILRNNEQVRASLEAINIDSFESLLIREIWTPSYIADHFSGAGIQTMDNPRLHYMAGKGFFMGENISAEYLLSSASVSYLSEYLLVQKYTKWGELPLNRELFNVFFRASIDKVRGGSLLMAPALKLKAYLSDPDEFPLSEREKGTFRIELIPFITNSEPGMHDWSQIGLEGASFREKAQVLLEHVQMFRSWIVPYPVDGLQALLQEGMAKGKDDYEKNWCALQLALLLIKERYDKDAVDAVLNQIIRRDDGTLFLREQDIFLLDELERLMVNRANHLEGT